MRFSQNAWSTTRPIYDAILQLPFLCQLAEGTLPRPVFVRYLMQDALYLTDFSRALALVAARVGHAEDADTLLFFATEAIAVEKALHTDFFRIFNVSAHDFSAAEKSPVTECYTGFLLSHCALSPVSVALAALLPCFWIYREAGKHIHAGSAPENPYRAWISTYADEGFSTTVDRMIALTDRYAGAEETAALKAYHRSAQLEWLFWERTYQGENWPI